MNKLTYKQAEDRYLSEHPQGLYLNSYQHNPSLTLEQFLKGLLIGSSALNTLHKTMSGKTSQEQCSRGRRRSLGDTFLICKTYYPDCTLKEIHSLMTSMRGIGGLYSRYCIGVRRRVWKWYGPATTSSEELSPEFPCENGWMWNETPAD